MNKTFVTTGEVTPIYRDGVVWAYYVGRKDMEPVHLLNNIGAYYEEGNTVMIDSYGHPWVKGKYK